MQNTLQGLAVKTMLFRTDDPIYDFNNWDARQNKWLEQRPICVDCGEHIQDDQAYYINGEWICLNCMDSYLREVLSE